MEGGFPIMTLDGRLHEIRSRKPHVSDIELWEVAWAKALERAPGPKAIRRLREMNADLLRSVACQHIEAAARVRAAIEDAIWNQPSLEEQPKEPSSCP